MDYYEDYNEEKGTLVNTKIVFNPPLDNTKPEWDVFGDLLENYGIDLTRSGYRDGLRGYKRFYHYINVYSSSSLSYFATEKSDISISQKNRLASYIKTSDFPVIDGRKLMNLDNNVDTFLFGESKEDKLDLTKTVFYTENSTILDYWIPLLRPLLEQGGVEWGFSGPLWKKDPFEGFKIVRVDEHNKLSTTAKLTIENYKESFPKHVKNYEFINLDEMDIMDKL